MNIRKRVVFYGILGVLIHLFPFTMIHVHAQEHLRIDEEIIASFRANKPEYLALSTSMHEPENQYFNQPTETIQAFSFVHKTFRTNVDQPIRVQFTSKLPADQILIRIPKEGMILTTHLSKGETIQHSHGEYWILRTQTKQTEFTLPVVFNSAGQYFLTIDHDADQFYLEVEGLKETIQPEKEELSDEEVQLYNEVQDSKELNDQRNLSIDDVVEHHLSIPDDILNLEDTRVLEETRDSQDRSTSNVGNWSQFRSAWNSSSTTRINISSTITEGLLSLNTRTSSITIDFLGTNNFLQLDDGLQLSGSANLDITNGHNTSTSTNLFSSIRHNGSGKVSISSNAIVGGRFGVQYSISVQNISFHNGGVTNLPINVRNNGTFEVRTTSGTGSDRLTGKSGIDRMILEGSANIYIEGSRLSMSFPNGNINVRQTWNSANLHLRGQSGREIVLAETDPDDFKERYPIQGMNNSAWVILNASGSNWIDPPLSTYLLSLQASPSQGGTPTSQSNTIQQGATTTITANPNSGYNFVHWEIVSGTGSSIESVTSETTIFTMGSQNTTVRAVYEENQAGEVHVYHTDRAGHELIEPDILMGTVGEQYQTQPAKIPNYQLVETPENVTGTFTNETISVVYVYDIEPVSPIDPLDPESDVDPENKPDLPEDQGLLSIDFVSQFNFGSQSISAHDQTYYAQPQRLLNEDGTVNEDEERPNYVQVSDRRSENERNGWQLAVTQKEQFQTETKTELAGAQLQLMNQQLVTAQGGKEPSLQATNPLKLVPGNKRTLVRAEGNEGTGTWIYRFGNADAARESVALHVPKGATPEATKYSTTLVWELSAVPGN